MKFINCITEVDEEDVRVTCDIELAEDEEIKEGGEEIEVEITFYNGK